MASVEDSASNVVRLGNHRAAKQQSGPQLLLRSPHENNTDHFIIANLIIILERIFLAKTYGP